MLLNLSNHPSDSWQDEQMKAAISEFGSVQDLPFPKIDPEWSSSDVVRLVEDYEIRIRKIDPKAVHIMGELTFTFTLVNRLKTIGIRCIASTTERIVSEDGNGNKTSKFRFVQFRNYV